MSPPFSVPYIRGGYPPVSLLFRSTSLGALDRIQAQAGPVDANVIFGEFHLPGAVVLKKYSSIIVSENMESYRYLICLFPIPPFVQIHNQHRSMTPHLLDLRDFERFST